MNRTMRRQTITKQAVIRNKSKIETKAK